MTAPKIEHVAVIGGGVAGVAAAWAAHARGARVSLYYGPAGATELASGAADLEPWAPAPAHGEDGVGSAEDEGALTPTEREFLRALGYWCEGPARIATRVGVVRPCLARDPALLDLEPLAGSIIGVACVERDDWDGAALARTLESSTWAGRTGTRFRPEPLGILLEGYERRIPAADFAALFDEQRRRSLLLDELRGWRSRMPELGAILCGPWLGLETTTLQEVQGALPVPVGECTSAPGGVAGLRFAAARARLLQRLGVESQPEWVERVRPARGGWELVTASAASTGSAAAAAVGPFSCVVLAVGGLVSGGIEFTPRQETGSAFRLCVDVPVQFSIDGEPLEQVSSCYGFDPMTLRGAWIERAGVHVDRAGRAGPRGLFAVGDVAAGRPRTVLAAARSAIKAVGAIG